MGTSKIVFYAIFEGIESFCKSGVPQYSVNDCAALYSRGLIFDWAYAPAITVMAAIRSLAGGYSKIENIQPLGDSRIRLKA